jgi:Putative polyhydroxyalkanoic acid system protein (PHA_gran_rgn)
MACAVDLFVSRQQMAGEPVPDPLVVTISHHLGREEAKRRLENGLGYIRDQLAGFVSAGEFGWIGHRLDFNLTAMKQSIRGRIDVEDRLVRVELDLPLLLRLLSKPIIDRIRKGGRLLLDKPGG